MRDSSIPRSPHILLLGVLGDGDALAIGFQLMLNDLSVCIVFNAERVVQHPCDVIISKYTQRRKKRLIIILLIMYAL